MIVGRFKYLAIPIQSVTFDSLDGRTRQKTTITGYLGLDDISLLKWWFKWLKVARTITVNGVFCWFIYVEKENECSSRIHDANIPNADTLLSVLVWKVEGGIREPEGMSSILFREMFRVDNVVWRAARTFNLRNNRKFSIFTWR